jgi:hypothetical protein
MNDVILPDVMVDIETTSLHQSNALILSIGVVRFDPRPVDGVVFGETTLIVPSITEQLLLGRLVDPDTMKFWAAQPPEASDHWAKRYEPDTLVNAMTKLKRSLLDADRVWANGIVFDLCNLADLYQRVTGERLPWHYRAPRDMRTFCEELPQSRFSEVGDAIDMIDEFKIVAHEPISDCVVQAHRVWQHWPNA